VNSSSFPAASVLTPGYKLDRYELLCPLAQGGMASVWLARLQGKHGFEKLVAIKTILPHFAADARFRQMFLDEARIASRIEHANVAQILDLGEQHDVLYLVMEWIEGDALSKVCRAVEKDGQLIPLGIILRILADACAGLHAAHELCDMGGHLLNVVHRDVSPQNILVNNKGIVKVIDFGVAKARDRHADETTSGILKGKIQYMAPEQAVGKTVDRRADIWAIGAILYRMLSGRSPYEAENQLATLHLLSSGVPPAPLPPEVPRPVAAVIRRALTHNVDGRYATAAELQTALEAAMRAAQCMTRSSDVAAYVGERLLPRALARKEALALALKSAAERSRVAKVFQNNTEVTSGVERPGPTDETISAALRPSSSTELQTLPLPKDPNGSTAEGSIGTLASASIDAVDRSRVQLFSKRKIALAMAVVSVGFGATFLLTRSHSTAKAGAAAQSALAAPSAPVDPSPVDPPPVDSPPVDPPIAPPPLAAAANVEPPAASARPSPTPAQAATSTASKRLPRPMVVVRPKAEKAEPMPATPKKRKIDDGF
jgi:serine/threonine-protein kinase